MLNQKTIQMIPQNCNMLVKVLSFINNDEEEQSEQEMEKKQKVFEILRTSMQLQDVDDQENDYESDYIPVPCEEACLSQQSTQKSQQSQYLRSPLQTFTQHFQNQNKGYGGRLFTLTDQTEYTVDDRKPTHTRGPSKIQEILQDLQANVADDIMKMANDIIKFTENSSNTNGSVQIIPSDQKLKNQLSEQKNIQQQRQIQANNHKDGFKLHSKTKILYILHSFFFFDAFPLEFWLNFLFELLFFFPKIMKLYQINQNQINFSWGCYNLNEFLQCFFFYFCQIMQKLLSSQT